MYFSTPGAKYRKNTYEKSRSSWKYHFIFLGVASTVEGWRGSLYPFKGQKAANSHVIRIWTRGPYVLMAIINLIRVAWQAKYTKIPYFGSNKW